MASRYPPGGLANDAQQAAIHRPVGHDQHIFPLVQPGLDLFPKNASNRVYNPDSSPCRRWAHNLPDPQTGDKSGTPGASETSYSPSKSPKTSPSAGRPCKWAPARPFRKNLRRLPRPASEARQSTRPGEYNHIFPCGRRPARPTSFRGMSVWPAGGPVRSIGSGRGA